MSKGFRKIETVTASEIADFVFCPESWRLDALGRFPNYSIFIDSRTGIEESRAVGIVVLPCQISLLSLGKPPLAVSPFDQSP
jgi:hypothetical protein